MIPEKYYETVIMPFLAGKYSEIDKEFVKDFIPKMLKKEFTREPNIIRQIIDKDPKLRTDLETSFNIVLSPYQEI